MSDNEDYSSENISRNRIDGLKVFIKAKLCFKLDAGEQALFDSYDAEEKKMIYDFLEDSSCHKDIENMIQEIIKEEELKMNKQRVSK